MVKCSMWLFVSEASFFIALPLINMGYYSQLQDALESEEKKQKKNTC